MPPSENKTIKQARARIDKIRASLSAIDYLCTGTLIKRMKVCGKPSCRCAQDPEARHGPYYEWGHMHAGKLTHRNLTPQQANVLRQAIKNYRKARKLLRDWEKESERLIEAENPPTP